MMTTTEFLSDSSSLDLIVNDMTIVATYLQVSDKTNVSIEIWRGREFISLILSHLCACPNVGPGFQHYKFWFFWGPVIQGERWLFVLFILVELLTINVYTFFLLAGGGRRREKCYYSRKKFTIVNI